MVAALEALALPRTKGVSIPLLVFPPTLRRRSFRSTSELSIAVAAHLDLSEDQRHATEFGSLLHDVGKIAIPREIIDKPGLLSNEEWEVMKTHTIVGQQMLNQVGGVLERVGIVVRASHESYDGRGYPDGLAREEIPIEARVVSCCDAFSAMTTDRSYRRAMTFHEAVDELDRNAGTQFDPLVVEALKFAIGARLAEDLLPRRDTPELVTPPVGLTDRMNHQPRASAH